MRSCSRSWLGALDRSAPLTLQCAFLAVFAGACQAQPSLKLDDLLLDPSGNSKVVFTWVQTTPGVSIDPAHRLAMRPYPTTNDNGVYRVYVAFDKISPTMPPSDIAYYLYSQPVSAVDKGLFTEHVVVGTPYGDFPDQWSSVRFHLTENGLHDGVVTLPIHCFSNVPLISVETDPNAGTVYLSSPDHKLSFAAKSLLKGFEVDIESADLTTNNEWFWKSNDPNDQFVVRFNSKSKPPYSMTTAPLSGDARVVPNVWSSLLASARTLGADQAHDVLTLTVRHNAGMGGTARAISIPINVRFRPPWWSLLAAAMIGAVLGSSLTLKLPANWKGTTVARTFRSAVLLAVVAEVLGMILFLSDKSKLAIAGFNLDPTQTLPAMGLGILVGLLGLRVLDAFKIPLPKR